MDLAGCCARCTASSQFRSRKSAPTVELPWRVHRGRKHRSDCCESAERMLHEAHLEADAEAGGVVRRGALRAAHQLPAVPADLHTITDTCDWMTTDCYRPAAAPADSRSGGRCDQDARSLMPSWNGNENRIQRSPSITPAAARRFQQICAARPGMAPKASPEIYDEVMAASAAGIPLAWSPVVQHRLYRPIVFIQGSEHSRNDSWALQRPARAMPSASAMSSSTPSQKFGSQTWPPSLTGFIKLIN